MGRRRKTPYSAALFRLQSKDIRRVWVVGQAGCGKTYVAERLAVDLGFALVRTRDFVRRWALDRNITPGKVSGFLENVYATGAKPILDSINKYVNRRLMVAARTNGIIIDSAPRTPEQLPIYLNFEKCGIVHVFAGDDEEKFIAQRVSMKGEAERARIQRARALFPPLPELPIFTDLDNEFEL